MFLSKTYLFSNRTGHSQWYAPTRLPIPSPVAKLGQRLLSHTQVVDHIYYLSVPPLFLRLFSLSHLRHHDLCELLPVDWRLCHVAPESSLRSHPNSTPLAIRSRNNNSHLPPSRWHQPSPRPNAMQKRHSSLKRAAAEVHQTFPPFPARLEYIPPVCVHAQVSPK